MTRPPRTHRQPQRHRLHAARLIARHLQPLHLHRPRARTLPHRLRRPQAALSQQIPDAAPLPDKPRALHQRIPIAKPQRRAARIRRRQRPPFVALHSPSDSPPRAYRIHPQLVAQRRCPYHRVGVRHPHQRPQRECALILHPALGRLAPVVGNHHLFASDSAVRAMRVLNEMRLMKPLPAHIIRPLKRRLPKIARRQRPQPIEHRHIRYSPQRPIFLSRRPQTAPCQIPRYLIQRIPVVNRNRLSPPNRNRLQILRSHHRPRPRPRRLPSPVVGNARKPRQLFPRRPYARHPRPMPQPPLHRLLSLQRPHPHQVRRVQKLHNPVVYPKQTRHNALALYH